MKNKTEAIFAGVRERLSSFHELVAARTPVIAFSGGKDSAVVLLFYRYLHQHGFCPEPVLYHLDHGIRDNALQEKEICDYMRGTGFRSFCKKKNIPEFAKELKKTLEETGRIVRYGDLRAIADVNSGMIVTGHHSDDYLESLLIHLIRGGGEAALETLQVYRDNVFRPLVFFTPQEIVAVLDAEQPQIFADESNADSAYLRNRIRKNMVPLLQKEGLDSWKLYHNFHDTEYWGVSDNPGKKNPPAFLKIHHALLQNISLFDLKKTLDVHARCLGVHPLQREFLVEILRQLQAGNTVNASNGEIGIYKAPAGDMYLLPDFSPLHEPPQFRTANGRTEIIWNSSVKTLNGEYEAGNLAENKKIFQNGMQKEISELMRERQIPRSLRANIPLLVKNQKVKYILFGMFDKGLGDMKSDD